MKKLQIKTLGSRTGGTLQPLQNDWGNMDGGGIGGCTVQPDSCTTTCYVRAECCCFWNCPSGGTWVCKSGYCAGTSMSCL